MADTLDNDHRIVLLAAMAFLHWRDTDEFPDLMSDAIDGAELAAAIDRLSGTPTNSSPGETR